MNIVQWLPRYYRAQQMLTDLPSGARVLDIACGEGDLAKFISDRGARVWGADLSPADIHKGFPRNCGSNVIYVAADAGRLPFTDATFDWVLSFDTLEVIPNDRPALSEFVRVLKRGGTLLISVPTRPPNAGNLFASQRILRHWLPRWFYSRSGHAVSGRSWFESTIDDIIYFRNYDLNGLLNSFPGFDLIEYDYALKIFSALAMDVAYGVRGFPRFKLKSYAYWISTRLDALFCRGPRYPGYTLLVKLRKQ
jgi:SAM-dependent methyltransferase